MNIDYLSTLVYSFNTTIMLLVGLFIISSLYVWVTKPNKTKRTGIIITVVANIVMFMVVMLFTDMRKQPLHNLKSVVINLENGKTITENGKLLNKIVEDFKVSLIDANRDVTFTSDAITLRVPEDVFGRIRLNNTIMSNSVDGYITLEGFEKLIKTYLEYNNKG